MKIEKYAIDSVVPLTVEAPSSTKELSNILSSCSSDGRSVSPVGGNTRTAIGNTLTSYDVALDTTRINELVAHNAADLTVTVQAGMTFLQLQSKLADHGQFLAIDPPLPERATIGGTLAIGSSGPLRWQDWRVRDLVIGMKVAAASGVITKSGGEVVKNVSGYDMSRLHVGGLGTLGVITEASFKLTPIPDGQATVTASFRSAADAFTAGMLIFHGKCTPLSITWMSPVAAQKLGLGKKGSHHLAVRLHGRTRTLERMVDEVLAACNSMKPVEVQRLDNLLHDELWRAVSDFGWNETTKPSLSMRISLPPATVGEVLASLESAGATRGLMPAIVAYLPSGTVLLNLISPEGDADVAKLSQVVADARKLTRQRRGTAVIEQAPIQAKSTLAVWEGAGDAAIIMQRLKDQYDPGNLLNPGRYL